MKDSSPRTLVVIDGKSVFYRGYYAMPRLADRNGTPTGGVFGFMTMAFEVINRLNPDYIAVAWDKPKTNIRRRRQLSADYKANRSAAPDDFYRQVPILMDVLKAFNWPLYEFDDYEADDIMGTLAAQASQRGINTVLVSSDLDLLQLIDDHTTVYALKKGLSQLDKFDPAEFQAHYQIRVDQFRDLKSLKGDASDNIAGVAGVGEKTAIKLLQQYGDLDNIYSHIDDIEPARLRDKLISGKDMAYLSRQLVTIWRDAPVQFNTNELDARQIDIEAIKHKLNQLGFNSLLRKLNETFNFIDNGNAGQEIEKQADQTKGAKTEVATSMQSTDQLVRATTITQAGIAMDDQIIVACLDNRLIIGGYSSGQVMEYSAELASQLIRGRQVICYDGKALAKRWIEHGLPLDYQLWGDIRHGQFMTSYIKPVVSLQEFIANQIGDQAGADQVIELLRKAWKDTAERLQQYPQLMDVARHIDFPLQSVLAKIESRGIYVDKDYLKNLSDKFSQYIKDLEHKIYDSAGIEFNILSPKQLSGVLYDTLQLPPPKKRSKIGVYSTNATEMARLRGQHPVVDLVIEYREISKLKSTFIDAILDQLQNGRIHTTLEQNTTSTGRLASSDPNLQNIPTRTELGRQVKQAFIASPGKVLVAADYAQFELRLAAALSKEQGMIEQFSDETVDIHQLTAALVYGVTPDKVTDEQRRHAKTINFGVLYGMGPKTLAESSGMTMRQASDFIDRYFVVRPKIKEYINHVIEQAEQRGYVATAFGRIRLMPDLKSTNAIIKQAAKRAAQNMPIQGTEADLMKMAMIRVEQQLPRARQIIQVHDSIVLEVDPADADETAIRLKQIMEQVYPKIGVRLLVDIKVGKSLADV